MRYIAPFEPLENGDGHALHGRAAGIIPMVAPQPLVVQGFGQDFGEDGH